mmetsp:Transcript_42706/g.129733  ORF Transcript_42706/g.129733 Transcript_42706/m.129733 type:complete len:223 (-) Transcript_42706:3681-4349(-)
MTSLIGIAVFAVGGTAVFVLRRLPLPFSLSLPLSRRRLRFHRPIVQHLHVQRDAPGQVDHLPQHIVRVRDHQTVLLPVVLDRTPVLRVHRREGLGDVNVRPPQDGDHVRGEVVVEEDCEPSEPTAELLHEGFDGLESDQHGIPRSAHILVQVLPQRLGAEISPLHAAREGRVGAASPTSVRSCGLHGKVPSRGGTSRIDDQDRIDPEQHAVRTERCRPLQKD